MNKKKRDSALNVLVIELAKDCGYKLSKNERKEVASALLDHIYILFDTIAHDAQTDFVC